MLEVLLLLCVLVSGVTLPPQLKPGDTVAFVSPCSPPCDFGLNISCPDGFQRYVEQSMAAMGLKVKWGKYAFAKDEYLAGTDEERAFDLTQAFLDPSVAAIVATRGGEGSSRMLHLLNISSFPPKIIVGYSDMTAVLNAVHTVANVVTFHGPMGISNWTTNGPFWQRLLMDPSPQPVTYVAPSSSQPYVIRAGVAKGKLVGGNLSILTNILGSRYAPLALFEGAILFVEDVDEAPYKIDRYMTQLALHGVLDIVAGVVFGQCTNCVQPAPTFTIQQILHHHLAHRPYPSFAGAMFGHIDTQITIPIGVPCTINATEFSMTFGPAVSSADL